MRPTRRGLIAAIACAPAIARAQADYPNRAVRVLVGFPPGGGVDNLARVLVPKLSALLGQSFVVENRAGANGNIAMEAAAKSPADGYTLLYGNVGNLAVTNALYRNLPFDTARDFIPIAQSMESALAVTIAADIPARTLPEFIAYARANPGKLNAGSAGAGGPSHLAFEMFKRAAGLDIVHVPYRGSAPAIQDLAGGRVQLIIDGYALVQPVVEAGRARVLALTSAQRQPAFPDIPTVAEVALPGFEAGSWHMLVAPAGTPAPIIAKLEAAMATALRMPDVLAAIAQQGIAARYRNAAEARAYLLAERERWGGVVREAGITAD